MRHLNTQELISHLDGQTPAAAKASLEGHLAECRDCRGLKQELEQFVLHLQEDSSFEPPAELVQWGVQLFQPMLQPAETLGQKIRKIAASLVFDTFDQPSLVGVRRVGAAPRQLLYRAGDIDVDVKIESMEANDRISLTGQVLSNTEKFFNNTPVKLESQGSVCFRTTTNFVGEFIFDEVPKDTYHLSVDLPEGQVTLFCVHRSN